MRHNRRVTSDEIRETFLRYFEAHDHLRLPSASLVPSTHDASVLLTTAGMHPLVPYFKGEERPPHPRLASCQKCFRTTDIENVGNTARHLTFFEMLGNFSVGDYFKQAAVEMAWELSLEGFGFKPEDLWISVFEGDEELGLGPDEEAIEAWLSVGVPRERIVLLPRSENFWQAGTSGPCGPCSELYIDRGAEFGTEDDLPGGENDRFLEYWNLVFTQYDLHTDAEGRETLTALPASNIDTGLGLERMAVIQQGVETVFETDTFAPLMALGRELASKDPDVRALRILADHARAMTFLIADGVVPSNEDRGYILRRIMRRAIQQGHRIGIEPGFLPAFAGKVIEVMGAAYPELHRERDAITGWVRSEEEGFGRTLEQGTKLLEEVIERSRKDGTIPATDAFKLHDTFGFPFEVTRELALEQGLEVDTTGFDALMDEQRARARAGGRAEATAGGDVREHARELVKDAGFETDFTGYETLEQHTTVGTLSRDGGRTLVKLAESPFYATGGGQVADTGVIECEGSGCRAAVTDVVRVGDDQALVVEVQEGELHPGERVVARVDRAARTATAANHTATHLLHAALRERLGTHVRQAGSYVGPDKLRFDFTHGEKVAAEDLRAIEDRVNEWVLANEPVRPITTTLDEARALGAMALFGEKYGDIVRMVQIGDGAYSRELCGGTHVRSTAEIGVFKLTSEGSSAANVRRIEAITGPAAVAELRSTDAAAREAAAALKTDVARLPVAVAELRDMVKSAAKASSNGGGVDVDALAASASQVSGADVVTEVVNAAGAKELMDAADRVKGRLGVQSATVLGTAVDGRVHLVAAVSPALVERGVKAGAVVKAAAQVTGGGGGGRDTMAQAGGKDPAKLPDAIAAARAAIEAALAG
ncbi:MAG: alanyl-tRNA synthetase [Solirubrobacteraceae bacterium]|jgi:alanyl-tRNA synthetase|nr:alanyl-tRNA synthetase [Solirubrobacteraceae bacterium]